MLSLDHLIKYLPLAWDEETRGNEHAAGRHPAAGQCVVSSLLVQKYHDGDIVRCIVGGTVHYFNIINEMWIDTTRAQFGKRTWPYKRIEINPHHSQYIFNDTWYRVGLLEEKVKELIW